MAAVAEGRRLFVGGLHPNTTEDSMGMYFSREFLVSECMIKRTPDGHSRGFGFVTFQTPSDAEQCFNMQPHMLDGKAVELRKATVTNQDQRGVKRGRWGEANAGENEPTDGKKPKASPRDPEDQAMRKLFVGNLHTDTTLESMKKYFEQYGEVEQCYCAKNETTGKCKGYGFITFKHAATCDEVQRTRPHTIQGRVVDCKRAVPKEMQGHPELEMRSKKLYIAGLYGAASGLNDQISDADLEAFFGKLGKVVHVDQKVDKESGKKRGYGYVDFTDEDAVDKCVLLGVHELKGAQLVAKKGLNKEQQEMAKNNRMKSATGQAPPYDQGQGYAGWGGGYGNTPQGSTSQGSTTSYGGGYTEVAKQTSPRDPEDVAMRKLFVGSLHLSTTQDSMRKYFEQFGEIEQCYCAKNESTGKGKGYGFITFKYASTCDEVQNNKPHTIQARVVDTKRAVPKEYMGQPEFEIKSKKLYIAGLYGAASGLNDQISDEELMEYFGKHGKVVHVDQKVDTQSGKKRGYGYVDFTDEDAVDKCVLLGVHKLKGAQLSARKGLNKEQQEMVKQKKGEQSMKAAGQAPPPSDQGQGYSGWGGGYGSTPQGPPPASSYGGDGYGGMQGMMMNMMHMCQQMMMAGNQQNAEAPGAYGYNAPTGQPQWDPTTQSWTGGAGSSDSGSSNGQSWNRSKSSTQPTAGRPYGNPNWAPKN